MNRCVIAALLTTIACRGDASKAAVASSPLSSKLLRGALGCYFIQQLRATTRSDSVTLASMAPFRLDSAEAISPWGRLHRLTYQRMDSSDTRAGWWGARTDTSQLAWLITNGFGGVFIEGALHDSSFVAEAHSSSDDAPGRLSLGRLVAVRRPCVYGADAEKVDSGRVSRGAV
jgi:hypothetical protein